MLFFSVTQIQATHIAGGEITLKHIDKNNYQLNVTLFFDLINGNLGAQDTVLSVSAFDKATNMRLDDYRVSLISHSDVKIDSGVCQSIKVNTRILQYSKNVMLDSVKYSGDQGFYLAWERCCRNLSTINLVNPLEVGTTFYTEFPPINRYINSSPVFNLPARNGYACIRVPFTLDFSAIDSDGDSLGYEIVLPYEGHSSQFFSAIIAESAPYGLVPLASGFNVNNLIPGSPPLSVIDTTGMLSFTAKQPGIYAFTLKCSEYRNGVYLGSVRRDYQLAVLACAVNSKPGFKFVNPVTGELANANDTLPLDFSTNNCVKMLVINTLAGQDLSFQAVGENFSEDFTLNPGSFTSKLTKDTSTINICLPACIDVPDRLLRIKIFSNSANNCTVPRLDTIFIIYKNTDSLPKKTIMKLQDPVSLSINNISDTLHLDLTKSNCVNVLAILDKSGLSVSESVKGINFNGSLTMQPSYFTTTSNPDTVNSKICLPACIKSNDGKLRLRFTVRLVTNCNVSRIDTGYINVVNNDQPEPPVIQTIPYISSANVLIPNSLSFKVSATGNPDHSIYLYETGNLTGSSFPSVKGKGTAASEFSFVSSCQNQNDTSSVIHFIARDSSCLAVTSSEIAVKIAVRDTTGKIIHANVITPNDDQINDYFDMSGLLPDNCTGQFIKVEIYNRWGRQVFESFRRDFQWLATDYPDGLYYYIIKFTSSDYKSWLMVQR